MRKGITAALGILILVGGLIGIFTPRVLSAQGAYTAEIQLALRTFLGQVHSWTATQTFQNITVNGTCTGTGCAGGGGGGAPTTAKYILQASNGSLPNAQAMGGLSTGLVINTITTGVQSIYGGSTCTSQFVRSLSASGTAACATVVIGTDTTGTVTAGIGGTGQTSYTKGDLLVASAGTTLAKQGVGADGQVLVADSGQTTGVKWATISGTGTVTHTAGALTASALMVGNGAADSKVLGSLGSTTTVLHGNAAGLPSFGPVDLTADVGGILPTANGGTGIAYFTAAGPTIARTYTFPDASAAVLTDNTVVTGAQGGTGVANSSKTITLGGNLTTAGAFATTLTMTAGTSVTLPTSGTLATTTQITWAPTYTAQSGTPYTAGKNDWVCASNVAGTVTLTAAATTGAGGIISVKNCGSGTITIARSGSDTIDGATSQTLNTNDQMNFMSAGGTVYWIF